MAQRGTVAHFFQFVFKLLKEQGISAQELVDNYAAEYGFVPASKRDFVGTLVEFGIPVQPEDTPVVQVAERIAEREAETERVKAEAKAKVEARLAEEAAAKEVADAEAELAKEVK